MANVIRANLTGAWCGGLLAQAHTPGKQAKHQQSGLTKPSRTFRGLRRPATMEAGGLIKGGRLLTIPKLQEMKTVEDAVNTMIQVAADAQDEELIVMKPKDFIKYHSQIAMLHTHVIRNLLESTRESKVKSERLVESTERLVESTERLNETEKAREKAMEMVRRLGEENGNMVLRVFLETALKEMHRQHLGPLTDPACVAYQQELVKQNVIQLDPLGNAYLFKKPRFVNKPKAIKHFAECKTCKSMIYSYTSPANEVIIPTMTAAALENEIAVRSEPLWQRLNVPHHLLDSSTRLVRLIKDGTSSEAELLLLYSMIKTITDDVSIEEGPAPPLPEEMYVARAEYLNSLETFNKRGEEKDSPST